jgi:DNA (cytosine-5)-methyltransferase 1
LREGAALQTFPSTYRFFGNGMTIIARQIGNAVPPLLARKIAEAIKVQWQNKKK